MTEKDYTDEQVISVGRIKKCKDYYEILEVSKDATEPEIKKKYRKLALALHPDKNKAPGAIEAFKAVGNAFAVLSDKDKRKQYDMYGSESQSNSSSSRDGFATYNYSRGFDADISPEEIFNMFFGGAFPTSSIYVRRNNYNRYRHYRQDQESYGQQDANLNTFLFQFAPILLLIVLSVFSTYLTPDAVFMLNRSSKYSIERETARFQIKYFVKDNFMANYGSVINEIEASVISEYISLLRSKCYKERNHQEAMIWKAKAYRDVELEKRAKEFRQPSCEKLYQFSNLSY